MPQLSLTCTCTINTITFTHSSPLPLSTDRPAYLCPCDTCRFGTGFLSTLLLDISKSWLSFPHAHLPSKKPFKTTHHGTKYFCSHCGSSLYYAHEDQLTIFLPALRIDGHIPTNPGLESIVSLPTGDALKSSISSFLTTAISSPHITDNGKADDNPQDILRGTCLCQSTHLSIRRPPVNFMDDPQLKDWVYPSHSSNPTGKPRLAIGLCHCHSCRLGPSTPFYAWIFTPRSLLTLDGDHIKSYDSEPEKGERRRFCGSCGAQVSFSRRDDMCDVSCALMDLEELKKGRWGRWSSKEVGEDEEVQRRPADGYIEGWVEGRGSFEAMGEEWWRELVANVKEVVEDLKMGRSAMGVGA